MEPILKKNYVFVRIGGVGANDLICLRGAIKSGAAVEPRALADLRIIVPSRKRTTDTHSGKEIEQRTERRDTRARRAQTQRQGDRGGRPNETKRERKNTEARTPNRQGRNTTREGN